MCNPTATLAPRLTSSKSLILECHLEQQQGSRRLLSVAHEFFCANSGRTLPSPASLRKSGGRGGGTSVAGLFRQSDLGDELLKT
jgi:hypothetical protein